MKKLGLLLVSASLLGCGTTQKRSFNPASLEPVSATTALPEQTPRLEQTTHPENLVIAETSEPFQQTLVDRNTLSGIGSTLTSEYPTFKLAGYEEDVPPDSTKEVSPNLPFEIGSRLSELYGNKVDSENPLELQSVIDSVYMTYPLLESALYGRNIALGQQIQAEGAFDLKIDYRNENGALGFYQTYRQNLKIEQPLFDGGSVFGNYKLGRGSFEPWYEERETNGGGEFKVGLNRPFLQNRDIDPRRAEYYKSGLERRLIEADIQAQLIGFVQEGSFAYWDWVAAGAKYRIAKRVLELATERTDRIRSQTEEGLLDPPELTDNLRLVAERQANLAKAQQNLQKAAIKLSLFFRDANEQPIIPDNTLLPEFPEPTPFNEAQIEFDVQAALNQRPEIGVLQFLQRQLDVEYAVATNQLQPELDGFLAVSQDTGVPTSSKNDKGEFEMEASLFFSVPVQRRKARGKITSVQGKIGQVNAKRQIVVDKIGMDVRAAGFGLINAYEQISRSQEAVALAEELAERERINLENGASDLLNIAIREQFAVEASEKLVDALLNYFQARANYRAALAIDRLP